MYLRGMSIHMATGDASRVYSISLTPITSNGVTEPGIRVTGHFAYGTLRLMDSSPIVWSFCLLDTSPTGHFAYRTFRLLDSSPTILTVRLLITLITENFNVPANLEKKGLYRT